MNAEFFKTLFDYNYAAYHRLWNESIDLLSEEDFKRSLEYSIGSIHDQVIHMMSADWIWLSRLQGTSPGEMFNPADFPTREAIRERWNEIEAMAWDYVSKLTDDVLDEVVEYTTTIGRTYRNARWQILANMINHATDHRAQVLAMIHGMGGTTFQQDMIHYLRGQWTKDGPG